MALSDPTSLAVKQIFTTLNRAWWNTQINRQGIGVLDEGQLLPIPLIQPESEIVITWTETESGPHKYEIVSNRGLGTEKRHGTAPKGASSFRFIAKRGNDAFAAYTLPISIRAVHGGDNSAWVDVTATFAPATPPTEPVVSISFDANSADIAWVPGSNGSSAALVTARGLGESRAIAQWLVVAPKAVHKIGRSWGQLLRDDALLYQSALSSSPGRGRWDDYLRVFYPLHSQNFEFSVREIFPEKVTGTQLRLKLGPEGSVANDWTPTDTDYSFANSTLRVSVGSTTEYDLSPLANAASTFTIISGTVAWINLVGNVLVITPTAGAVASLVITGTRTSDSVTKDAVLTITATTGTIEWPPLPPSNPPTPPPVINVSPSFLNNGFTFEQGAPISIQLAAAGASEWEVTGLPTGLEADTGTGRVFGAVAEIGRYTVTFRARAENSTWSAPVSIPIKIIASSTGINLAAFRFPWLAVRWMLTDLQLDLVGREVTSSRSLSGAVPLIRGDKTSLALLCILSGESTEVDSLTQIRLILRPLNNVSDSYVALTVPAPTAETIEGAKYYPLDLVLTPGGLLDALELAARRAPKGEIPGPVMLLAEIELTVGGGVFSSRPFKAAVQLDANR